MSYLPHFIPISSAFAVDLEFLLFQELLLLPSLYLQKQHALPKQVKQAKEAQRE